MVSDYQVDWAPASYFRGQARFGGPSSYFGHAENGYQRLRHCDLVEQLKALHVDWSQALALDVGCGDGTLTGRLQDQLGLRAFGCDFEETLVSRAHTSHPEVVLSVQALPRLAFLGESFDLVLASEVLYYLKESSQVAAIDEFCRVLRPGGYLLLTWVRGEKYFQLGEVRELLSHGFQEVSLVARHMTLFRLVIRLPYAVCRLRAFQLEGLQPVSSRQAARLRRWNWLISAWISRRVILVLARGSEPLLRSRLLPRILARLGRCMRLPVTGYSLVALKSTPQQ